MSIERLYVGLELADLKYEVGELVRDGLHIRFKFYPDFLDSGLNISPIKLPFNENVHTGDLKLFDGLFGVFNDSLPDGWGKLLLDRMLISRGENPSGIHPLDRLAYVGASGPGALTYLPSMNDQSRGSNKIELDILAKEMHLILDGSSSEIIEDLFQLGGSSGGARPKIQIGYNNKNDHLIYGINELPNDYEHWLIKFPSSMDRSDVANIEYAYHLMALDAGIEMEECKLFEGNSGACYFGTKRFDRIGNQRLHMHSASGIMHDDFRFSQMDYGHLMDCAFNLERHVKAYESVLRLAAFNVFSHNRDDHSNNFSFIMNETGEWRFAPAYDLTFSSSSLGMHSTMVAGESRNPNQEHLLELANVFGVKNGNDIIDQVIASVNRWPAFAIKAGVTAASKRLIETTINSIVTS